MPLSRGEQGVRSSGGEEEWYTRYVLRDLPSSSADDAARRSVGESALRAIARLWGENDSVGVETGLNFMFG